MRIRIERLRVWLLASAALLLVVLAGFIGAARYVRRHWLGIIPGKLAANVRIDSSGITKSFTHDGQTDYVIHAGKYVERKDGKAELHDVWMKLCGRKQQRADMVRGDDWEWDQKTGVIRAIGVVHIALRPAAGKPGCNAQDEGDAPDAAGAKTLNVTTSNLVYMDKLGVAATSAPIEFQSGALKGNAVGADYSSDAGTLMLHSAVSMTGTSAGQPVELHATSAEMDGQQREVRLTDAKYVTGSGPGSHAAAADQTVLHLRPDQTLERIEAQGNVTMQANGGTVTAAKANVTMNPAGHAASVLLAGGVHYAATTTLAERQGEAREAAIAFDGKSSPQAQRAVFTGAVHFVERTRTAAKEAAGKVRELSAAKLDIALASDGAGKSEVRDAEATGGAKFTEVSLGPPAATEIAADELKAHFAADAIGGKTSQPQLETIAGTGQTLVRQVDAKRVETSSAGDTLIARFRPGKTGTANGKGQPGAGAGDLDTLASAVQTGHILVTRNDPAKLGKGNGEQRASSQQVSYDGSSGEMTLTGGVQLADQPGELWANDVALDRATGDAVATGGVRAQYTQAKASAGAGHGTGAEPAHVLADRAELDHATDVVTFHGAPARMWQGGSQVLAPVIEMDKAAKRLIARGENGTGFESNVQPAQVSTVLMSAARTASGPVTNPAARGCATNAGGGKQTSAAQAGIVRIASGALVYSGILGEAQFTGGLRAETAGAAGTTTVRANSGTVWLTNTKPSSAQNAPSLEGNLDRMVANGSVIVDRPGLRATGERLLYTANNEDVLLSGDAANPPRATDARGSSTTGPALRLHRGCGPAGDTVEVLNRVPGEPGSPAGDVHTESRVEPVREKPRR